MHKIIPNEGNLVTVEASGKLTQEDYDALIPSWKAAIARYGKIRLLFVMHDFHGWDRHAAWDDFRFGLKHDKQVERIAMVGEKKLAGMDDKNRRIVCGIGCPLLRCLATS